MYISYMCCLYVMYIVMSLSPCSPYITVYTPYNSPFDFLYYRPYYGGYYGSTATATVNKDPEEMGFLEGVFSYIFGDGNPNPGLEERRLSLVANMIRNHEGSVTAEQLAPYCHDVPPPPNANADLQMYVDESFVLPIVTQLNGEPRVTEDGDIIYVFPELQQSVATTWSTNMQNKSTVIVRSKHFVTSWIAHQCQCG